ncbi:MAG: hypothetical protein IKG87_16740 [Clostridia bacterium]|nr:hypothetical protein [Clostridia bacterium]
MTSDGQAPKRSKAAFGENPKAAADCRLWGRRGGGTARSLSVRKFSPGSVLENNHITSNNTDPFRETDGAASHGEPGRFCIPGLSVQASGPTIPQRAVVPEASPGIRLKIRELLHRELAERGLCPSGA